MTDDRRTRPLPTRTVGYPDWIAYLVGGILGTAAVVMFALILSGAWS